MFDDKANRVRCDTCGKFMKWQEPGSSWMFVPSSDAPSYEENAEQCKRCTEKHGPLVPMQNVAIEKCSGVYA